MTYSDNLEIQQLGKKIKVEDDQERVSIVCSHDFWNEAPEDLLTEIFIRLPDCRSASRASTVYRRWHSSIRRNPRQFIERFNSHHRRHSPDSLPWAVMFRPHWCSEEDVRHVSSDDWLFLHGKLPDNCFDFLPNSSNMQIKASCNDLFLVSDKKNDLYICNPIAKQFMQLPAGPRLPDTVSVSNQRSGLSAYAVLRTPDNLGFKVVQVLVFFHHPSALDQRDRPVPVAVFCSVSRKWETRSFPCPGLGSGSFHSTDNYIVTVDGVMYWRGNREILLYLDLEKDLCGTIGIAWPRNTISCHHRIGAVAHELRLMQVEEFTERIVYLTVWKLNQYSNWILVHGKRMLARPENLSGSEMCSSFARAFFHPTNGDLVLYVWGKNVIEFNLVDATYKKIAELPRAGRWSAEKMFLMVGAPDSAAALDS